MGFNEAGGFLPRKPEWSAIHLRHACASMRPEDFSPGNLAIGVDAPRRLILASMRPEDFSPGNSEASRFGAQPMAALQ